MLTYRFLYLSVGGILSESCLILYLMCRGRPLLVRSRLRREDSSASIFMKTTARERYINYNFVLLPSELRITQLRITLFSITIKKI